MHPPPARKVLRSILLVLAAWFLSIIAVFIVLIILGVAGLLSSPRGASAAALLLAVSLVAVPGLVLVAYFFFGVLWNLLLVSWGIRLLSGRRDRPRAQVVPSPAAPRPFRPCALGRLMVYLSLCDPEHGLPERAFDDRYSTHHPR